MREVIRIVLVIIGAFIGAGFASGQEIWIFFNIAVEIMNFADK